LARQYYQASLNYVSRKLGLDFSNGSNPVPTSKKEQEDEPPHSTMVLFTDVGTGLRVATDLIQRQRFYRELENFMLQVGVEHTYRLSGAIPSVKRYLEIRTGSVGCAPQIAITE
jgi:hypothetical protein